MGKLRKLFCTKTGAGQDWLVDTQVQRLSNVAHIGPSPESLVKHKFLGSTLRVPDSADQKCGLRFSISNQYPGQADTAEQQLLGKLLTQYYLFILCMKRMRTEIFFYVRQDNKPVRECNASSTATFELPSKSYYKIIYGVSVVSWVPCQALGRKVTESLPPGGLDSREEKDDRICKTPGNIRNKGPQRSLWILKGGDT